MKNTFYYKIKLEKLSTSSILTMITPFYYHKYRIILCETHKFIHNSVKNILPRCC